MAKIKIDRESFLISLVKVVSLEELTEIDTSDIYVESIVIDPDEKKALIHYHE